MIKEAKYDYSRPFQVHIISSMVRQPTVMARLASIIDPDMFDDEIHGDIAAACINHYKQKGELLSIASVAELLTEADADEAIEEIWNDDISDPEFVIDRCVSFAKQKAVELAVLEAGSKIEKGEHDNIVELMRNALAVGDDLSNIGAYVCRDSNQSITSVFDNTKTRSVPTGIAHLDKVLGGGLEEGTLGSVLAAPKRGKSYALVNFGVNAARGLNGVNVVHYSLEMSEKAILRRYYKRMAGGKINAHLESDFPAFKKKLRGKIKKNFEGGADVIVKGFATRSATPGMIRAHLTHLISTGFVPGLVIVDYADIMKPERRLGEVRHEQASIYEDLRAIAQDFSVPMWTASQANRGAIDKDIVTMKDIGESFEKAMIVDVLIALCRTEAEMSTDRGRFFIAALREKLAGHIIELKMVLKDSFIRSESLVMPSIVTSSTAVPTKRKKKDRKLTEEERKNFLEKKANSMAESILDDSLTREPA